MSGSVSAVSSGGFSYAGSIEPEEYAATILKAAEISFQSEQILNGIENGPHRNLAYARLYARAKSLPLDEAKQLVRKTNKLVYRCLLNQQEHATEDNVNLLTLFSLKNPRKVLAHFEELGCLTLTIDDRLTLLYSIASADDEHAKTIITEFPRWGMADLPFDRLYEYSIFLAGRGPKVRDCLADYFDKLGFTAHLTNENPGKTFYCKMLARNAWAFDFLLDNSELLGIVKLPFRDRLAIFTLMGVHEGSYSAALEDNFPYFGFVDDVLNCKKESERVEQIVKIATAGAWAANSLITHFEHLGLAKLNFERRLNLCATLVSRCTPGRPDEHFPKLGFPSQPTLEEIKQLVKHRFGAVGLAANLDRLDLSAYSLAERLEICMAIAEHGPAAIIFLNKYFLNLRFIEEITACEKIEDKFTLTKTLVSKGSWIARNLAVHFRTLGLDRGLSPRAALPRAVSSLKWSPRREIARNSSEPLISPYVIDRTALCELMIRAGQEAGIAVIAHFRAFDLGEVSLNQRLTFCNLLAEQASTPEVNEAVFQCLVENFENMGFVKDINRCFNSKSRIDVYTSIASQGDWAVAGLNKHFGANYRQRLARNTKKITMSADF